MSRNQTGMLTWQILTIEILTTSAEMNAGLILIAPKLTCKTTEAIESEERRNSNH